MENWEEELIKEELQNDVEYKKKMEKGRYFICAEHLKVWKAEHPNATRKETQDEMSKFIKNLPNEYTMFIRSHNNLQGMLFNRLAAIEQLLTQLLNVEQIVHEEKIQKFYEEQVKKIKKEG